MNTPALMMIMTVAIALLTVISTIISLATQVLGWRRPSMRYEFDTTPLTSDWVKGHLGLLDKENGEDLTNAYLVRLRIRNFGYVDFKASENDSFSLNFHVKILRTFGRVILATKNENTNLTIKDNTLLVDKGTFRPKDGFQIGLVCEGKPKEVTRHGGNLTERKPFSPVLIIMVLALFAEVVLLLALIFFPEILFFLPL